METSQGLQIRPGRSERPLNRPFAIDSNVAIYAFSEDSRSAPARALLESGPRISVQLLNEFANVSRRKARRSWDDITDALTLIESVAESIRPLDLDVNMLARELILRYNLSFYDCLIVAAALLDRCETLYSEDMQHGLVIDNRLTILNPFTEIA